MNDTDLNQLSFEAAYAELDTIIMRLESGELPLDESVTLFERGRTLADYCQLLLDNAELRVKEIGGDV